MFVSLSQILLASALLKASVTAFTVTNANSRLLVVQQRPITSSIRPSTCRFAQDGAGGKSEEASKEKKSADPNDILNSPAFLKRKLEVLKSDYAKLEEELTASKKQLEDGKAEWGSQLDELQQEVRFWNRNESDTNWTVLYSYFAQLQRSTN
jgi:hypothetical protein